MANNYKSKKNLANTTFKVPVLVVNIHIHPTMHRKDIVQENEYLTLDVPNKYRDVSDNVLYDYVEDRVYSILFNKLKAEVNNCQIFLQDQDDMEEEISYVSIDEAYEIAGYDTEDDIDD